MAMAEADEETMVTPVELTANAPNKSKRYRVRKDTLLQLDFETKRIRRFQTGRTQRERLQLQKKRKKHTHSRAIRRRRRLGRYRRICSTVGRTCRRMRAARARQRCVGRQGGCAFAAGDHENLHELRAERELGQQTCAAR